MTFQTFQRKQLADACMPAHPVLQRCSLPDLQVHAASRPHDGPFCSSHVASGFPAHAHLKQLKLCSYGRRHVDDVCPRTPPPPFDCQETPLERPVLFVNTFLQLNKGTKTERNLSKMFYGGAAATEHREHLSQFIHFYNHYCERFCGWQDVPTI